MRGVLGTVIELAGLALVGYGIWTFSTAAGMVWAGLIVLGIGIAAGGRR